MKSKKRADNIVEKIISGNRNWTEAERETYINHSEYIEKQLMLAYDKEWDERKL